MPHYTLIMDYIGGTYISQVSAPSPKAAMVKAAKKLEVSEIQGLGIRTRERLVQQVTEDPPVPLTGVQNVWCTIADLRGHHVLMNLVQTEV